MNHEDYERAASHWVRKDAEGKKMEPADVMKAAEEYILANNTCALATGAGDFVRCTPIEYTWHDGAFFLFSEGGEKFIALEENKKVSLAVFDKYEGFGKLKGLQVSGTAYLPDYFSEEYLSAAEFRHISEEMLRKLPEPMSLIKVVPDRMDFLNSDFAKAGYDARQSVTFPMYKG